MLIGNKLNLLQMVQAATSELALPIPLSVIGNTDAQIIQLLALANREGRETWQYANKNGGWQALRQQHLFNTAGVPSMYGNFTSGSPIITNITTTTGVVADMVGVASGYLPSEARVVSVDSPTQVTMDQNATATGAQQSLYFGQDRYVLPSDFGYFMTQTFWDRNFRWQLLGPLDAQEWQVLKSGISPTGPRRRFRVMDNYFNIDPVPAEVDQEVFEYYSAGWCQSSGGTVQTLWAADTDNYILDDDTMILGLKWRYLRAKGLDYQEERKTYDDRLSTVAGRDGGNRNLPMNATASGVRFLNETNVPDTGYGS